MIKRTAVYVRGKTRFGKAASAAFIAVVLAIALLQTLLSGAPAEAVTINECPGGSSSGTGGQECPNLRNYDLHTQDRFPRDLYRGDARTPTEIFRDGFTARGSNDDLVRHVHGGEASRTSNYVSTTGTLSIAEQFARSSAQDALIRVARQRACSRTRAFFYALIPLAGPALVEGCRNGVLTAHTYIYVINPRYARNALYVPDQIRGDAALFNRFAVQDEWAYVHHIPNYAIVGVRVYTATSTMTGGLPNFADFRLRYNSFRANVNYRLVNPSYNPALDVRGNFGINDDLNIPAIQANPYTRSCSTLNRCRR